MVLNVHSDILYLCKPKIKSKAGFRFFVSDNDADPGDDGIVLKTAKKMKSVMSLAADANIESLFLNSI